MKNFFLFMVLSLSLVFSLPINDNSIEEYDEDGSEDGWFVPQKDGSLKWMTEEDAQMEMRALTMSRRKPKEAKVQFYLYTPNTPEEPEEIFINDVETLEKSNFNSEHETRIIIHGYLNNYKSEVNTIIREAFLTVGEYNVICVDWSDKADRYNYLSATRAVPEIGQRVANLIEFLREEGNIESKDLKVIGHSLGAHVAGHAGKFIEGEPIHTIIGLDPAFPLYRFTNCEERLCSSDAIYVESIHTNGRLLGFLEPVGKTAFYPNGGKVQPGCGLDITGSCSHSRAYTYYAEAIRQEFLGLKCPDWKNAVKKDCQFEGKESLAGFDRESNHLDLEGSFYSPVNKKSPYGLGNF